MSDLGGVATTKSVNSDIVRVYPGAVIEIYTAGTDTLIASTTADGNGIWAIATLVSGKYDIKVDGAIVQTIHHITIDHTHTPDISFTFFESGDIVGDSQPGNTRPFFIIDAAGTIEKIIVTVAHVDASGDLTVHLCQKTSGGGSPITYGSDSVWSHQINPGSEQYGYLYQDNSPALSVSADDLIALAIDWTASDVEGVAVTIIYRKT